MRLSCARVIFVVLLPAGASAQRSSWQVPAGGAVHYTAQESSKHVAVDDPAHPLAPPWTQLPHAAVLLASELDASRTHLREDPVDVWFLAPWLCFDLRWPVAGGSINHDFAAMPPYGQVRLRGKVTPIDADGRQQATFTFEAEPLPGAIDWPTVKVPPPKRGARQPPPAPPQYTGLGATGRGELQLDRVVDLQAGVVQSLRADLAIEGDPGPRWSKQRTRFTLHQEWRLPRVAPHRDPELPMAIAAAIDRAVRWLRTALDDPRQQNILSPMPDPSASGGGTLALALLTLLAAEVRPDDELIARGFDELRRRELTQTYPLALALQATERRYAPLHERDALIDGRLAAPSLRQPDARDGRAMNGWAKALLALRDSQREDAYVWRWSYEGPGYDNSNTQFALLGLHSAQLCGEKIPIAVWSGAAAHFLTGQHGPEGKPASLHLTLHAQARSAALSASVAAGRTQAAASAQPRGWGYHNGGDTYGNMTSAGIGSLALCLYAMREAKLGNSPAARDVEAAIRDGFLWWSQHRSVRRVPSGNPDNWERYYCYGLYGLERACELNGVAWIDDWDWYHDGVEMLLASQRPDGSFAGSLHDTCFAVLFLKKAHAPVVTPR